MDSASSIPPRAASRRREPDPAPAGAPAAAAPGPLDSAALRARLAAEAATARDAAGLRAACVAILREAREEGAAQVARLLAETPEAGPEVAAATSRLTDQVVLLVLDVARTWLHPLPNPTAGERLALLATGGYGRGEMAPHSDVDLLVLTPWKQTAWGESLVESMLYMLWDLRFKVGHAIRTVDDCLRLARQDVTIRTALLERRLLAGDAALAAELDHRLWKELFSRTGPEFVEAKLAERDERHRRHGGSRYLLEPNVKEGKGGLRDLQTLYWIAKYLYHAADPAELVERGLFTPEEYGIFREAGNFLWTVRCHLHLLAGRAQDQLTFDSQVEIAARLGYRDREGRRAVEAFMQRYFSHAKQVGELTRIFCAMLEARHVKGRPGFGPRLRRAFGIDRTAMPPGFRQHDGRIDFADEGRIAAEPILILRLFQEGLRTGLLIHPDAFRAVARRLDLVPGLRGDPAAAAIFLDLLLGNSNPERALRRMNETGVLGAYLPEFGEIVCLMQFNMYHHYTVDEHSINCVSILSRIEKGELREELPVASEILRQGVDRTALFLAVLLHDIGKGRPGDHSVIGEAIARTVCTRLGLDQGTVDLVAWLVRHHLLMSDYAQKRDISDPRTVKAFAETVRSPERLKLLCVLTVSDIMGVGPGVWNNWKAQLLRQLYRTARAELTGAPDVLSREAREQMAKAAFAAEYGRRAGPEAVAAELARHYAPYWLGFDTATQLRFAEMAERIRPGAIESDIQPDPDHDATKAMFYMEDHPGIFSRMAGALALAGANVVDARTYTTTDGFATMAFWVQDRDRKPFEHSRLDRLRRSVERTLRGEVVAREEFKTRDRPKQREKDFTVQTRILWDNEGSDIYTIIEVSARDRPGLLYDLTRTLAANGITISSAVIATYGEEAVDVFYVKDVFGLKIVSEAKRRTVEARLRAAIEGRTGA